MKRAAISAGVAALLLAGCAQPAQPAAAANDEPAPAPALELTGRVVDEAAVLGPVFEVEMTDKLAQLEEVTGVQLVVVTTPSLKSQTIEMYSVDLARAWGIGSEERLDGLMVLVAPQERQVRIEVGYGLEASVKDEEAAEIIASQMLPRFRESDFEGGVEAGVQALIDEVTPYEAKETA